MTFSPMISHRFSIGFKSGLCAGHQKYLNSFIVDELRDTIGSVTRSIILHRNVWLIGRGHTPAAINYDT